MKNKKRLKYGTLSIALSAVVIALVILANAFFTSFASKNEIYTDLTKSQLYTISEPAKEYLKQIKAPITIKFAVPEDTISQYYQLDLVYRTAKNFALLSTKEDPKDEIPDITVEYFDSYKHPAEFEKYKKLTDSWSSTNVVIESVYQNEDGTESAYPLVYSLASFFSKSSSSGSYVGYNGERRFLLAFLQLAGIEQPVVAFTKGHGEPIGTSLTDESNEYADFMAMFEEFGFRIQYVDLTKGDLDPDCRLVVILDPQRDFIGKDLAAVQTLPGYPREEVAADIVPPLDDSSDDGDDE